MSIGLRILGRGELIPGPTQMMMLIPAHRRFTLERLCLDELPFDRVSRVPARASTPGFRAIACYDGTEISAASAYEPLQAFTSGSLQ